jgi:hypothetical protein
MRGLLVGASGFLVGKIEVNGGAGDGLAAP